MKMKFFWLENEAKALVTETGGTMKKCGNGRWMVEWM